MYHIRRHPYALDGRRSVALRGLHGHVADEGLDGEYLVSRRHAKPLCEGAGLHLGDLQRVIMPVNRGDLVAGPKAGGAGRGVTRHEAVHGGRDHIADPHTPDEPDEHEGQRGQDDVHGSAGDEDEGLLDAGPRVVAALNLLLARLHAGDATEAAGDDQADAVLGLPAREGEQARREADHELLDPHLAELGGEEVPQLMHEDAAPEDESDGDDRVAVGQYGLHMGTQQDLAKGRTCRGRTRGPRCRRARCQPALRPARARGPAGRPRWLEGCP